MVANINILKKIVLHIGAITFLPLRYIKHRRTDFFIHFPKSQKITICRVKRT